MTKIVIIDYGLGNLRSAQKGLEHCGADVIISKEIKDIDNADGLVLPGVGAFKDGMKNLSPITQVLRDLVDTGKPLLGICLGMQMLMSESEEGGLHRGLDFIPGRVVRFSNDLKVPHMGWNSLNLKKQHTIFHKVPDHCLLYFVHSYYVDTTKDYVLGSCKYGVEFAAVVANKEGNIIGTQFHPEKSGDIGLRILKNFVDMCVPHTATR
ncbi:MAG TPA: imidazole glycerol phosphate synthase subunit HisH [Methanosarcinales archaeon]|nr:imidazole glycerol phosphate synthase subunit HisH [Methanosarcinales archaeon]